MRRAAPPQMLRVDPTDPGPWSAVTRSSRGLGLQATPPPAGDVRPDERALRPTRGVPHAVHRAAVVNGGAVLVTASPGVARTFRLPDLAELFDRRPPGLCDVRGAAEANAALLRDDVGWRAVVLPSMGDLAADLGPGPIAVRSDGRRVAVVHEGALFEVEIPGAATTQVETTGTPGPVAFAADGTIVVAYGAGIGSPADGSPVTDIVAASAAPRVLTRHEDGTVRLWDAESLTELGAWTPGLTRVDSVALDARGTSVAVCGTEGETAVSLVVDATTGVPMRAVRGAATIAFGAGDDSLLIGGDWGLVLLETPRENI